MNVHRLSRAIACGVSIAAAAVVMSFAVSCATPSSNGPRGKPISAAPSAPKPSIKIAIESACLTSNRLIEVTFTCETPHDAAAYAVQEFAFDLMSSDAAEAMEIITQDDRLSSALSAWTPPPEQPGSSMSVSYRFPRLRPSSQNPGDWQFVCLFMSPSSPSRLYGIRATEGLYPLIERVMSEHQCDVSVEIDTTPVRIVSMDAAN